MKSIVSENRMQCLGIARRSLIGCRSPSGGFDGDNELVFNQSLYVLAVLGDDGDKKTVMEAACDGRGHVHPFVADLLVDVGDSIGVDTFASAFGHFLSNGWHSGDLDTEFYRCADSYHQHDRLSCSDRMNLCLSRLDIIVPAAYYSDRAVNDLYDAECAVYDSFTFCSGSRRIVLRTLFDAVDSLERDEHNRINAYVFSRTTGDVDMVGLYDMDDVAERYAKDSCNLVGAYRKIQDGYLVVMQPDVRSGDDIEDYKNIASLAGRVGTDSVKYSESLWARVMDAGESVKVDDDDIYLFSVKAHVLSDVIDVSVPMFRSDFELSSDMLQKDETPSDAGAADFSEQLETAGPDPVESGLPVE